MKRNFIFFTVLLSLFLSSLYVMAQTTDQLIINGYAVWGYGSTNGNSYLLGDKDGVYENYNLALAITANSYQKLYLNSSFEFLKGQIDGVSTFTPKSSTDQI